MNVEHYVREVDGAEAIDVLAQSDDGMEGRVRAYAFSKEIDRVRGEIETNPTVVASGDVREDFRYKLGVIEGLKFRGTLIVAARERRKKKQP